MIGAELRAHIRRLFFAEHWKAGTIAAELGVHHTTVTHALETERFINDRFRGGACVLDPFKPFVLATLERYPRLRASRLHEMIADRGYAGSVVQLRRYVRAVRPEGRREAFLRLSTLPGEQAQVDWGSFGKLTVGHAHRQLSCFVLVLGWSRAMFARFTLDQTLESFVRGHVLAFETLGGVPRSILYDNLKSAVLERHGDLIRFQPRLLELAGHYHFAPKPCAPYRGNEKGKVERTIQYLRHSFFAARRYASLDDLNAQLTSWIDRVAHARLVPGDGARRTVRDALVEERARLLPLAAHRFQVDLVRPVASGKTPYVRFDLNDYSIPHTLVKKPLTLAASESTVRVLDGDVEVARHPRCYDRGRHVEEPRHLDALAAEKRRAHELRGRDRLGSACPHAIAFLGEIALHGGHLGGTTSRLLRLLDRYGPLPLDRAIAEAHGRGAFSAQSVAHVLDQRMRAAGRPPPLVTVLPDDPRVRELHVTPHSLASYDVLARGPAAADDDDQEGGHE
jgi:transposase